MNDSVRSSCPSKRSLIVIDGDDSANQQPTEKSVRREAGPVPSPEVLDIHQKLANLDNEKQAAIRMAGKMQARVEFLEKLNAGKLALVGGEKKKLVEELQTDAAAARKLMKQQQEKIDELTSKMAEYEVELQQKQPTPQQPLIAVQQQPDKSEIGASTGDSSRANVEGINTCPNLFNIRPTESAEGSVEFSNAVYVLGGYEKKGRESYGDSVGEFEERRKEVLKGEKLHCALCKKTFEKEEILSHFYSQEHEQKVADECDRKHQSAYIDCSPFVYWMRKLESMEKKPEKMEEKKPKKKQAIAKKPTAVAAPAANDGASSEDDDDEIEDEDMDEDYEEEEEDESTDFEVE